MRSRRILLALAVCALVALTSGLLGARPQTVAATGAPPDFGDGSDGVCHGERGGNLERQSLGWQYRRDSGISSKWDGNDRRNDIC